MSGRDLLLEYAFPIEVIEPLASPSTEYLKQVCVVAKPKTGQEGNIGNIYECLTMAAVAVRTDNVNAQQLFNAGMNKVFVLLSDELNLATALASANQFFTVLISDDFDKEDVLSTQASLVKGSLTFTAVAGGTGGNEISIEFLNTGTAGNEVVTVTGTGNDKKISVSMQSGTSTATQLKTALDASTAAAALITTTIASGQGSTTQTSFAEDNLENGDGMDLGTWSGVVGVCSDDVDFLADQSDIDNRTPFFGKDGDATNMFYAFGKLLSSRDWKNQQYLEMPANDEIDTLAEAEDLFDEKISFVLNSEEYDNRLALFTNNKKAIIAPYIFEWFKVSIQGWGVQYLALNQPKYTVREASLLQDYLEEKSEARFIAPEIVETITIKISLVEDNFVANGDLVISEPKALWRVNSVLQQGLI
jgi:hypothetical protein